MHDLFGIIAAWHFLGHASPEVTWKYHTAEKAPKPTGLGALLLKASGSAPKKNSTHPYRKAWERPYQDWYVLHSKISQT